MMKTRMQRPRIDVVRHTQLLDPSKTLEIRMLDEVEQNAVGNGDEAVNRVVKYFFSFHRQMAKIIRIFLPLRIRLLNFPSLRQEELFY